MIRPLLSLLLLLLVVRADAQVFGNEWINYSQKYYRIKVWNDGVYRIPWTALSTAIPELAGTDPRNVQLFGRGEEQYIHVEGETDGTWKTAITLNSLDVKTMVGSMPACLPIRQVTKAIPTIRCLPIRRCISSPGTPA